MKQPKTPKHYDSLRTRFPKAMKALEKLGESIRSEGPLDIKTAHLIQLAAAAAIQSEGSVHSHARRAVEAGATRDELQHTLLVLVSTIGFPKVAAAVSWVDDLFQPE